MPRCLREQPRGGKCIFEPVAPEEIASDRLCEIAVLQPLDMRFRRVGARLTQDAAFCIKDENLDAFASVGLDERAIGGACVFQDDRVQVQQRDIRALGVHGDEESFAAKLRHLIGNSYGTFQIALGVVDNDSNTHSRSSLPLSGGSRADHTRCRDGSQLTEGLPAP